MENTFSTNAAETIQKEIKNVESNNKSEFINKNLVQYFDIESSADWIVKKNFKKVIF